SQRPLPVVASRRAGLRSQRDAETPPECRSAPTTAMYRQKLVEALDRELRSEHFESLRVRVEFDETSATANVCVDAERARGRGWCDRSWRDRPQRFARSHQHRPASAECISI